MPKQSSPLPYKEQVWILKTIVQDIFWMARRYAHGRSTYAPSTVREAYKKLKQHWPELLPRHDPTLSDPPLKLRGFELIDDWLNDCNEKTKEELQ